MAKGPKRSSVEMFYLDADGNKQDADLWAGLLGNDEGGDLRKAGAAMKALAADAKGKGRTKERQRPAPASTPGENHPEKA